MQDLKGEILNTMSCTLQLNAERVAKQKREQETENIRYKMQGFVSAEKEKFERLAHQMKNREKDLAIKSQKLMQVEEIIKNSPCPVARSRGPLRDKNDGSLSCEETVSLSEARLGT